MADAQRPDEHFSRAELRYRIADAINDRLKTIPYFHASVKAAAQWLQHRRDVRMARAAARKTLATTPVAANSDALRPEQKLPLPPIEMRRLVGPFDEDAFDNPGGELVYPWIPSDNYEKFFDFGCGCGRVARQLMLQKVVPARYVGIDLNPAMIRWCSDNLHPLAPQFSFHHHDVFNVAFNPGAAKPLTAPFPVEDSQFTLVNALSVFSHLTEQQAEYYLRECARILHPTGVFQSSWFLFDKEDHPMMSDGCNALYVSYVDPSAAVIIDRKWLRARAREFGLTIYHVIAPGIRGHQWQLLMTRRTDLPEVELPPDTGPRGVIDPLRRQRTVPSEQ
jgi:SAM-dependent methyltransferase